MRKIIVFLTLYVLSMTSALKAQLIVEAIPVNPQSGPHNYFGVKVTLDTIYTEDVTVAGYIYDVGDYNTNTPFSVTVTAGYASNQTASNFYETDPTAEAAITFTTITTVYAGKTIAFDAGDCILNFESDADLLAVLNQLNADVESFNAAYEALHSDLDEDELDDLDEENGFDEATTLKQFESLFGGFCSKRAQLEAVEASWLDNNFGGLNPDSIDFTYDDAWNTVFNQSYLLKVNGVIYALTDSGMYINNVYQDDIAYNKKNSSTNLAANQNIENNFGAAISGPNPSPNWVFCNDCKTNKPSYADPINITGTDWYVGQKVRIFFYGFYQGVRGKVVFYKQKNNKKKKARKEFGIGVGGDVWTNTLCSELLENPEPVDQNPYTWGDHKKRRSLKADFWGELAMGGLWRTRTFQVEVRYNGPGIPDGNLYLGW